MTWLWNSGAFNITIKRKFANPQKAKNIPEKVEYNTDTGT